MKKKKVKKESLHDMSLKDLRKLEGTLMKSIWKVKVAIVKKEHKIARGLPETKVR